MIQDLKADSARWEQERRSHSGGTKASRDSPDFFKRSTKTNSPPARYSESSHRFSGAGPAQYETSNLSYPRGAICDSYTVILRYPGSDAPGYSGSNVSSSQAYQQYDNRTPGYNTTQYQGQPQAYPPPAVDSRYSNQGQASPSTPYNGQAYNGLGSVNHADSAPYVNVGAHQRYAQTGYDSQDTRMVDASSSRVYSSGSGYTAQGQQDPRAAYYSTSQVPGAAYSPQPVDAFVGRGSNYPATSQADYSTSAPPVSSYQYVTEVPQYETKSTPPPRAVTSTSTQAQTGHSGSSHSRREHRERDSYSKSSSDRHHRRTQQ